LTLVLFCKRRILGHRGVSCELGPELREFAKNSTSKQVRRPSRSFREISFHFRGQPNRLSWSLPASLASQISSA
jgi:hypothetical protein